MAILHAPHPRAPWNKGKLIGQKAPLKLKDIPRYSPANTMRS